MNRQEFERVAPERVGVASQAIMELVDDLENSETEMHGLMIMRHGQICAEGWWAPYGPGLRHGLQSLSKTYAATSVGIAYTQGLLRLDERLIDIFPEQSPANPSENLQMLTVRDVLCMGDGMDTMPRDSADWIRDFLHTPVNHKPGTTFMYNSTGSTLLGAIVRQKTGEGLQAFLKKHLFDKIGINSENLRWYCMADGMEMGGGGLLATTEDNLRLLKLYADGGVWAGERILAEDYIRLATTVQNESATESINNPQAFDNFLGYGFQIWMCQPEGTYRADGAMGQFAIVNPRLDMIVSINETAMGAHWAQNTLELVWKFFAKVGAEGKDTLAENAASAAALARRLRSLNLPNPLYQPFSARIAAIDGKTFKVQSGGPFSFAAGFFGMGGPPITSFSLNFDVYGCLLHYEAAGIENSVRIATTGTRFTNTVGSPADQTNLLCCDGAWTSEDTFTANFRWIETCTVKQMAFTFKGSGVTITHVNAGNNPFTRQMPEPTFAVAAG